MYRTTLQFRRHSFSDSVLLIVRILFGLAVPVVSCVLLVHLDALNKSSALKIFLIFFYGFFHVVFVLWQQFWHPSFVRLCLTILSLTYIPGAAACVQRLYFRMSSVRWMGWGVFILDTTLVSAYIFGVPLAQFLTLRSIQTEAIFDVMWWPGMRAVREHSRVAKRFGTFSRLQDYCAARGAQWGH